MRNFVIFHLESNENDIHLKLVKAYMNRLCIDENDQNEICGIYQCKTINNFEQIFLFPEWILKCMNFANFVVFRNQFSFQALLGMVSVIAKWKRNETEMYGSIRQTHVMFFLQMNDLTKSLLPCLSLMATSFNSLRSLHPKSNITFLHSRREKLERIHSKSGSGNFSIGDDIELFSYQLKNSSFISTDRSESVTVFKSIGDTLTKIECKRTSHSVDAIKSDLHSDFRHQLFLTLASTLLISVAMMLGEINHLLALYGLIIWLVQIMPLLLTLTPLLVFNLFCEQPEASSNRLTRSWYVQSVLAKTIIILNCCLVGISIVLFLPLFIVTHQLFPYVI